MTVPNPLSGSVAQALETACPYRYFFLFQKNLGVTNIQYAELLNQLRWVEPRALGVLEREEFASYHEGFLRDAQVADGTVDTVLLSRLDASLTDIFVIEPFFTCCVVHSPWQLDLFNIVSKCGYLHSCGPLIHRTPLTEANRTEFVEQLRDHLMLRRESGTKVPALVQFYTHESYPQLDWKSTDEAEGLVDIKLDYSKAFFGWNTLAAETEQLEVELKDLAIFDAEYYRRVAEDSEYRDRTETIFVIRDYSFSWSEDGSRAYPLEEAQFTLCYESQFRKNNRIHIADESKPYWAGSTTTPQRLMAAMLNLIKPKPGALICDPFAGTGTSILEAMKWPYTFAASDIFEPSLALDNMRLFGLSAQELDRCLNIVADTVSNEARVVRLASLVKPTLRRVADSPYLDIAVALDDANLADFPTDDMLGVDALGRRLGFYLVRKVLILRGRDDNESAGPEVLSAVASELKRWSDLLSEMQGVLQREEDAKADGRPWIRGHFARHVPFSASPEFHLSGDVIHRESATRLAHIADGSVYAFVTDPPYGFNTSHGLEQLLSLYTGLARQMFRALDPRGGHIVLCAVALSRTGKYVPTICRRKVLTSLLLREASLQGWTLDSTPGLWPKKFSELPWYWRSKRGVDRSILHFQFHKDGYVP
jgi:hypothetical protein